MKLETNIVYLESGDRDYDDIEGLKDSLMTSMITYIYIVKQ